MADIPKPDMTDAWANNLTGVVQPDPAKIDEGWIAEKPPFQNENWIQHRSDTWMQSEEQRGVPEWGVGIEYKIGSLTFRNDNIYQSLQNFNVGNDPSASTGWWDIFADPNNLITGTDAARSSLPVPGNDLNGIQGSGIYRSDGGVTLNSPLFSESFTIFHMRNQGGTASELAVGISNSNSMHFRSFLTSWSPWRKLATETALFNETARYLLLTGGALTGNLTINGIKVVMTYDIGVYLSGSVLTTEQVLGYILARNLQINTGLADYVVSRAVARVASTPAFTMNITDGFSTTYGTISFAASSSVGVVSWVGNFIVAAGQQVVIEAPSVSPTGMQDLSITLSFLTV